jgi:hypothetical protein
MKESINRDRQYKALDEKLEVVQEAHELTSLQLAVITNILPRPVSTRSW